MIKKREEKKRGACLFFLWDECLDFLCKLVYVFITRFRVNRQGAEVNGNKRIGTIGSNELEVLATITNLHNLGERNQNTLCIEQAEFFIGQHIASDEDIVLIPNLVVIAKVLFDESLCLGVQGRSLLSPLLAYALALSGRFTYVLLILIYIVINHSQIRFSARTQAKEHQQIGDNDNARIS